MIHLRVDGKPLLVGDNAISLKGKSPLLDRNRMPGIRNLPFKVPASDDNRRILGFPDDWHSSELPGPWPCEVLVNDHVFVEGELRVMEASKRWIECEVLDPLSLFYDQYGDLSIRFLDLGQVNYGNTLASITFEFLNTTAGVQYTIHFNGQTWTYTVQSGDIAADISLYFWNQLNQQYAGYATRSGANFEFLHIDQPTVDDPFEVGWEPDDGPPTPIWSITNFTSHVNARQSDWETWFTDVVNNPGNYDYCLPVIYAPGFYPDTENTAYNGFANWWAAGAPTPNGLYSSEVWEYACLPCVKLKPVLVALFEAAGYTLEIDPDFDTSREFDKPYLLNLYSIDAVLRQWDQFDVEWDYQNVFQRQFDLNKCLPEMSFRAVLNGVRITWNAEFDWNPTSKKVILKAADNALSGSPSRLLDGKLLGDYRIRYRYDEGYTFSHATGSQQPEELVNGVVFGAYVHGDGNEKVQNAFGVLMVINDNPIGGRRAPYAVGTGFSDYYELGYDSWPALLGLYRGLLGGSSDYPIGMADDKDKDGVVIANTYSLGWDGDQGLIEQFYRKWLYFMDHTRMVEIYLDPERVLPNQLSFFVPYRALHDQWILGEYLLQHPSRKKQQVRLYRV